MPLVSNEIGSTAEKRGTLCGSVQHPIPKHHTLSICGVLTSEGFKLTPDLQYDISCLVLSMVLNPNMEPKVVASHYGRR